MQLLLSFSALHFKEILNRKQTVQHSRQQLMTKVYLTQMDSGTTFVLYVWEIKEILSLIPAGQVTFWQETYKRPAHTNWCCNISCFQDLAYCCYNAHFTTQLHLEITFCPTNIFFCICICFVCCVNCLTTFTYSLLDVYLLYLLSLYLDQRASR